MKQSKHQQQGFTLLELLVVVAILAIIAGATISALSGQEERAGQGVTLNTMAALENSTRQHEVLFGGLPDVLDALYCADVDDTTNPADTSDAAATAADFNGDGTFTDTPFVSGGITAGLQGELIRVAIPDAAIAALNDAGLNSVRFVHSSYCNNTEAEGAVTIDGVTVAADDDVALEETDASPLFAEPGNTGLGRGRNIPLSNTTTANGTLMYVHSDPADIGGAPDDIIVVLGLGSGSSLISNDLIGRAQRDGNVPGAHYSHFSVALKIGEDANTDADGDPSTDVVNAANDFDDGVELVAILDSDGDFYDEEVAEFAGLQDE